MISIGKMLKGTWLMVATAALLAGCINKNDVASADAAMSDQEKSAIEALSWVEDADPVADAKKAIARKDLKFLNTGTRGLSVPGVDEDKVKSLVDACGVVLLKGNGDVVFGDTHLEYLNKAMAYAEKYNQVIAEYCNS